MYTVDSLFKATGKDGVAYHGGRGHWPLPNGDQPGEWLEVEGKIKPCFNGLHLTATTHLFRWAAPELYEVEIHPDAIRVFPSDKTVVSKARLVKRVTTWDLSAVHKLACAVTLATVKREHQKYPLRYHDEYIDMIHRARKLMLGSLGGDRERRAAEHEVRDLFHREELEALAILPSEHQQYSAWLTQIQEGFRFLYWWDAPYALNDAWNSSLSAAELARPGATPHEHADYNQRAREAEAENLQLTVRLLNGETIWQDREEDYVHG